jgi:hypothetical protein
MQLYLIEFGVFLLVGHQIIGPLIFGRKKDKKNDR